MTAFRPNGRSLALASVRYTTVEVPPDCLSVAVSTVRADARSSRAPRVPGTGRTASSGRHGLPIAAQQPQNDSQNARKDTNTNELLARFALVSLDFTRP
jgi:hypothetical protein